MIKAEKPLDKDAWLRRLGQECALDDSLLAPLAQFLGMPVTALRGTMVADQFYSPKLLTFRADFNVQVPRVCVLSLEEFDETLSGQLERSFKLSVTAPPPPNDAEEAEPFPEEGGVAMLDMLGDEIALRLSAFPRKPGATMPEFSQDAAEEEEKRPNPFAVLEQLKR